MISIAMTTYNGEKYLSEQLDSILNQTYKDFELIICDDCSKDSTVQILNEYATKDSRIKIFVNKQNLGFKKNFEKAILLCSGKYIALSDQDDVWTKNHLEVLHNIIGNYDIACGNSLFVDKDGRSLNKTMYEQCQLYSEIPLEKLIYKLIFNYSPFQGACMLIKKSLIDKCLPIPENIFYHDYYFLLNACVNNKIIYIFDVINNYRQHNNNVTRDEFKSNYIVKLKKLFCGIKTDIFAYVDAVSKLYNDFPIEFYEIKKILNNVENRHISISDIKILKRNYKYILTKNTNKGFLKFLFKLSKLKTV